MSASSLPSRRRAIAAAAVWLAIGLGANIALAWTVAVVEQRRKFEQMWREINIYPSGWPPGKLCMDGSAPWPMGVPADWPQRPATVFCNDQRACTETFASAWVRGNPPVSHSVSLNEYGWPLRSVGDWYRSRTEELNRADDSGGFIPLPEAARQRGVYGLPFRPAWPGLILNTLLYAAIAWGLWQAPLALRRRLRRRAGKCVKCGYDLANLPAELPCPECGRPRLG